MGLVNLLLVLFYSGNFVFSQDDGDTLKYIDLGEITIKDVRNFQDIKRLAAIQNTYIYSGKKNEIIDLTKKDVSLSEKYGRQIFSKVPGVFVYDMDGTGNQMNISTRGLDPHRGWEFNIRKDGIITNSDMYGYPASHYNIPMEAVEKIELVRGTGSLQYGAQFGGMLNYKSKLPPRNKEISFESINTAGSYGLVSTYNSLSGTIGKFRYYTYFDKKSISGYRRNSDSKYDAENISLYYDPSENLHIKLDWSHSNYVIHLAGPLTDAMFHTDPRSSTRSRNYYNPDIHVPSLKVDWVINESTKLRFTSSAVLGFRNSVMFDKPTTTADTINAATLQYNNRQVDIDQFNSYTNELRLLHTYSFLNHKSTFVTGFQYMNNDLHRQQLGKGTTGSDFDLSIIDSIGYGRDMHYKTSNCAAFIENNWVLFPKFSLNTGMRIESGTTDLTGKINYYPDDHLPNTIKHSFPLFGINAEYQLSATNNIYAGWSQAYRPVIMKDIIPQSVYEVSDKNLKDADGFNLEAGYRGRWKFLKWDITAFYMQYNHRLGTLAQNDSLGNLIIYRTNIGNAKTKGLEFFIQCDLYFENKSSLSFFTSSSYMDAQYHDATIRSGNNNVNIDGNKVESVPTWISRNGMTYRYSIASITLLSSFTSESYADALNAVQPNATGATGLVPSYHLLDMNVSLELTDNLRLQLNGNNILDKHYFTKRPQFYPGPGIWPSDGRTFSATVSVKI
jgi:Fe(3+) dicitrate transport protein